MKRQTAHLLGIFVTGALAALPLAATVAVFWWLWSLLLRWLPGAAVSLLRDAVGASLERSRRFLDEIGRFERG